MTQDSYRIANAKQKLGKKLVILGHHYQREEVIEFADFRGDSFGLSKIASEQKGAEFIVFCGVNFMAEAAKILSRKNQRVFIPDQMAGCPMADMASIDDVEEAWDEIKKVTKIKKVIPVTYMNSDARIKAFCGDNNGIICTSSNAEKIVKWAFGRGEKVFFFPDENLGRNTANKMQIEREKVFLWDINSKDLASNILKSKLILWPGYCHVHTYFTLDHIVSARKEYPGCKIIVHPECKEEIVNGADASGSTEGICKFVESSPVGSTIVVGTEINLVSRLMKENREKKVVPLARSLCPNMFRISLGNLADTLDSIVAGSPINEVFVPPKTAKSAKKALDRMLKI